jgi:hypothetical protein
MMYIDYLENYTTTQLLIVFVTLFSIWSIILLKKL